MDARVLYAGDTSLATAASYLAGVLTHAGVPFDYLASDQPIAPALTDRSHALYILSDYPVNNWRPADFEAVRSAVAGGAGLLMIGGWESFHGAAGEYPGSPLADVLPVVMQSHDDRVNSASPCVIEVRREHPVVEGLPFNVPPTVGGYNRIVPKPDAMQVLSLRPIEIAAAAGELRLTAGQAEPLLVVGSYGDGRTAAFASDVAPHWVGTLVDWGTPRITAKANGAEPVEVGGHYAELLTRLVRWTGRIDDR